MTISYVWARGHGRSQQLRSVLRQLPEPDRPRQREQPDSDRRAPPAAGARHDRAAGPVGLCAACWSCDRGSRGRRSTSFRTSSGLETAPAGCRAVRTLDFTLARPWRFRKYRFRAGLKLYNVFGASAERDVQNNMTSPDYGTVLQPDRALDRVRVRRGAKNEREELRRTRTNCAPTPQQPRRRQRERRARPGSAATPMLVSGTQLARRQQRGGEEQPDAETDRRDESDDDQIAPADAVRQVQAGGERPAGAERMPRGLPTITAIGSPQVPASSA